MSKEGRNDDEQQPFVSALRIFGVIRIWASIVIGAVVFLACVAIFVLSYTWGAGLVEARGEVARVECGAVQKVTECRQSGSRNTCITTESVACDVDVRYEGDRSATFALQYEEGYEPSVGDHFPLFFDKNDPDLVAQNRITDAQRNLARIATGIVGLIALTVVIVNIALLKNKSFRVLQGGLGAIGAIGGAL